MKSGVQHSFSIHPERWRVCLNAMKSGVQLCVVGFEFGGRRGLNAMKSGVQRFQHALSQVRMCEFECDEKRSATKHCEKPCLEDICVWMRWKAECNALIMYVLICFKIWVWMRWKAECNERQNSSSTINNTVWMRWKAECNRIYHVETKTDDKFECDEKRSATHLSTQLNSPLT